MPPRRRTWLLSLQIIVGGCTLAACAWLPRSMRTTSSAAAPPPTAEAILALSNAQIEDSIAESHAADLPTNAPPALPTTPTPAWTPTLAPLPSETAIEDVTTPTTPPGTVLEQPTPAAFMYAEPPENQNPLTGLPVRDPVLLERKPLGIKITNFPRQARPQWGLSAADLVFEYYLEHGLTRFFALFYGNNVFRVGPVRSARFFDEHLVRMYKSIFVFANADDRVMDYLLETELADYFVIEHADNCPPLCRDDWVDGYNNLFANTLSLTDYVAEKGLENERQELTGMYFAPTPPGGGLPGLVAETTYSESSYHRWSFDPASGRYLRFQDASDSDRGGQIYVPLKDRLTESQLAADNVVVIMVPHSYYSEVPEIVTMEVLGYGTAYAFRDGRMYKVFWGRATADSVLVLVSPDGVPFTLRPGNTFIEVIGESSTVWQFGDTWRFEFAIP